MPYAKPNIHPTAKIAKNAIVIGSVDIAEDVTILYNAVVRGDCQGHISIGPRTNLQEAVCVHVPLSGSVQIGADVSIGHGAIVHGCTIGDGTLVGMGATVIDGARVGKNCLIGAGALVTGTADIPDGMLVIGSPAKAVRALSPDEIDSLKENCAEYVKIGRELYEEGLL